MARARLRIYLGAAPGVGKTYAMLGEGHRRLERGTDVVVGFVEDHGRTLTRSMAAGLEVQPRRTMTYRGATFTELDLDGLLLRHPAVALVDELAHTNIPGSRNEKRWQDVQELLEAGIDVISTVNIQHLESLNDVVEKITGVPQREKVPDAVVRAADQVELVDMSPEALRRRMAHGNVYPPERVDAALARYFRVGNLTALRELALLWLADKVDEGLQQYRADHDITGTWETRERVVVALTGGPEGETLLRRGARIAARVIAGELLGVHVARSDGLTGASPAALAAQRQLVESLGGTYHQVVSDDVPGALLEFARAENATQLVLGASRRSWLGRLTGPGIGSRVVRESGDIDVHIVTHSAAGTGRGLPSLGGGLTRRRRAQGFIVAATLLPVLTALLALARGSLNLVSDVLVFQLAVVVVALVGGLWPAIAAAVVGSALLNYYFVPPLYTFTINDRNNVLALTVFVLVAVLVSIVVDTAARRTREAARLTAESELLATTAGSILRGDAALPALMERVREAFGMTSVTLLERSEGHGSGAAWDLIAWVGDRALVRPGDGDSQVPAGPRLTLVLAGRTLSVEDQRVLGAFAAQAGTALEQTRLAEAAAAAEPLAAADRLRTALLAAVGHDLRTPLSAATAAVTSLRGSDVEWTPAERDELLANADTALARLARLVDDLLDLSRLQAGGMTVASQGFGLDEVVALALDELGPDGHRVRAEIPEDLPEVLADPALVRRVVANLVANALRHAKDTAPAVTASALGDVVELRVVDRGRGIPEADRERVFAPFQRLGDVDNSTGVGLGLALSRGLVEAMGGSIVPEDTPGGGLTMVVTLPAVGRDAAAGSGFPEPGLRERAGHVPWSAEG
jgi:two-component system, OmpR family, sensor histidine kinase KdpD